MESKSTKKQHGTTTAQHKLCLWQSSRLKPILKSMVSTLYEVKSSKIDISERQEAIHVMKSYEKHARSYRCNRIMLYARGKYTIRTNKLKAKISCNQLKIEYRSAQ